VEYEHLKVLPLHENIILLLAAFVAPPTEEIIQQMPPEVQQSMLVTNNRTKQKRIRSTLFVVLDYHPYTMEKFLDGQVSIDQRLKFCKDIAVGLEYLWKHNLCHRDMKLSNLLISTKNVVVLCDFGLTTRVDEYGKSLVFEPGGNLQHLAPEIHNEWHKQQTVDRLSKCHVIDYSKQPQWELGTLCFEIIFGEYPFRDYPIGYQPPPNLSIDIPSEIELIDEFPKRFVDNMFALVSNDPTKRPHLIQILADINQTKLLK